MYTFAIVFFGVFPAALLFAAAWTRRRLPIPSPLQVVGWTFLVGYTMKSLYLAYAINSGASFRNEHISKDIIHYGLGLACLGVIMFIIGYLLIPQPRWRSLTPPSIKRLPSVDPRPIYYGVFLTSFILMAIYFQKMGFVDQIRSLRFVAAKFFVSEESGIESALGFLLIGADFIFVYFLYYFSLSRKVSIFNIYTLALVFSSLSLFLASKRMGIIIVIIAVVIASGVRAKDRVPHKKIFRYVAIVSVIIVLSFASQIRNQREAIGLSSLQVSTAVKATIEHSMQGSYFIDPSKLAAIVKFSDTPLFGTSFLSFLIAPVPRVLWPEKPVVRIGPYVAQEILDYRNQSGAPPSAIGELFINFGWAGVIIGMGILGAITAIAPRIYLKSADPKVAHVRYVLMMLCLIFFLVGDFTYAMLNVIKYGVAALVCEQYWKWIRWRKVSVPYGASSELVTKKLPSRNA